MGRVYRGEHVLMRKRVALKILHQELTVVPEVVQRFEREARAAAHIQHPHVATATDFGKLSDGRIFLVLEYVEGRSLDVLIQEGPVALDRCLRIGLQIASALRAAHEQGIIHRDLKPENILLVESEEQGDFIKVLDFGVAKIQDEGASEDGKPITKVGMVYGTPEYMAPEQALGQNVDARADLYSLGVVLYEMLCGSRPYEGAAVGLLGKQLTQPLPLLAEKRSGLQVPPAVEGFWSELLQVEKERRVPSAQVACQRLEELLAAWEAGTLSVGGARSLLSIGWGEVTIPLQALERKAQWRKFLLPVLVGAACVLGAWALHSALSPAEVPPLIVSQEGGPPQHGAGRAEESAPVHLELQEAKKEGLLALRALAEKFPQEALVHAELALALAKEQEYLEAVDEARVALALNPQLNESPVIAGVLFRAAQSSSASSASFRMLQGVMGKAGSEILYDLRETPEIRAAVRKQAATALRAAEESDLVTPALLFLLRLEREKDCEKLLSLLQEQGQDADSRALPALRKLQAREGCGPRKKDDCFACLREGEELSRVMERLETAPEDGPEQKP